MQPFTWQGLAPATMRFNEALVNGPFIQPSNAWTNLAYVLVGVFMIVYFRKDGKKSLLAAFSGISVLVGISSFLYHASNSFFFQVFDLSSMYLLSAMLVALNVSRFVGGRNSARDTVIFLFFFLMPFFLLMSCRGKIGAVLFGAEVVLALVLEILILIFRRTATRYRELGIALLLFLAAFVFWVLDLAGVLFRPENHLVQGHGIWHIVNSLCFIFLYRYYRQFRVGQRPE